MTPDVAIDIGREAIYTSLLIGAPILLTGMIVGLLIGLLQAVTQVQDQTVSFVPKIVAMVLVLTFCLPWLMQRWVDYSRDLYTNIPQTVMRPSE